MRCPFDWKPRERSFSFGVDGEFVDFCEEQDRRAKANYEAKYITCWQRFKYWLGIRA